MAFDRTEQAVPVRTAVVVQPDLGTDLTAVFVREVDPRLAADADRILAGVALIPVDDDLLAAAETIPPSTVATLDAIHLVTALRLAEAELLDVLVTYDARLAEGARSHGLTVLSPA